MLWLVAWMGVTVLGALGALASANSIRFGRGLAREARQMWSVGGGQMQIDRVAIEGLPGPVGRYLAKAIGGRKLSVRSVRLRHGGTFRTKLDGHWFPIRGEQYFSADAPAFVWWGRIRMAPGFWVDARDRCVDGLGNMRISLESTLTMGESKGPELDQGAMVRLLAEMAWFPTAFLDARHVTWTAIDGKRARATLRISRSEATAVFEFGQDGLPLAVFADRYRIEGGKNVLAPWSGQYADYREVDGLLVPHRVDAAWHVEGRRIPVLQFLVEQLDYDVPSPF